LLGRLHRDLPTVRKPSGFFEWGGLQSLHEIHLWGRPMKVSEILKVKGNILFTVTPDTALIDAVDTMSEKDIGSLVVMQGGSLVGLLSFREVMKAVHRHRGTIAGTVGDHMDREMLTISPDTEVNEVRRVMLERHARYVPVLDGKVLLGVMSFYDVAKAVFEEQSFENKMLKAYIRDWPSETTEE
jgi:CBS domain-containing protein